MTRRHIAWLIGIFVIGLVLATRNAPLRRVPPGFTLLPSTLPSQPRPVAGPAAFPKPKPPAPETWFSTDLEIDRMCHEGNYGCDPGICHEGETCDPSVLRQEHPQPRVLIRTFRLTREEAQRRGLILKPARPVARAGESSK